MKINAKNIVFILTLTTLCSCQANLADAFSRTAPDEFEVMPREKLAIPTEFSLPEPGKAHAQKSITNQARELLIGSSAPTQTSNQPLSGLEKQIANAANTSAADDSIRSKLENEKEDDSGMFEGMNAFKNKTIDPVKENARIKKAIAENKPINKDIEVKGNLERFRK